MSECLKYTKLDTIIVYIKNILLRKEYFSI